MEEVEGRGDGSVEVMSPEASTTPHALRLGATDTGSRPRKVKHVDKHPSSLHSPFSRGILIHLVAADSFSLRSEGFDYRPEHARRFRKQRRVPALLSSASFTAPV